MAAAANKRQDTGRAGFEKREKRRTIRALQEEIGKNNIDRVRDILKEEFDVDFQYRGQTALQLAVREGHYEICQLLLGKGANVNKCDAELNNLLNMACWRGYTDVVQLLINNEADMNARNDFGATSLNTSVYKGFEDICQKLVDANCDLNIPNTRGQSPLHTAVWTNRLDIVRLLLDAHCDVNNQDEDSQTPLSLAAKLGHSEIVLMLLNAGADVNIQDKFGKFALFEAACKGFTNIVREITKRETTQLNLCTTKGVTALLGSIRENCVETAIVLLESGCNPNIPDRTKQTPIHAAVRQVSQYFGSEGTTTLVQKLIQSGCDVNVTDSQGWCPIYQSAFAGHYELTKLLLESGANLTELTVTKESVLHGAVSANVPQIVQLLISAGCCVNTVNQFGEHPLYTAVKTRANIEIIQSLITAGSNVNLQETQHLNGPLHEALVQHHTEAALQLLQAGCNLHLRNSRKQDPLYVASEKGNDVVLAWLLKSGEFSDRGDHSYPSPLHAAVYGGQMKTAVMLIEAGFDINKLNEKCMTPIQTAAFEDNFSMAKLLLQYGCDLGAHVNINSHLACCLQYEDTHPHFELEPMFFAVKHRNIEMMKLFLTCYFHLPYRLVKTIGVVLQSTPELYSHYPLRTRKEIIQLFVETLRFPRSLQAICRSVILENIGACPQRKVPVLPVAEKVKEFLLQSDFFDSFKEEVNEDQGKFQITRR